MQYACICSPPFLVLRIAHTLLRCQPSALTHNKSYREGGSCVKISVTEGGKGDTTQHTGIRTGIKESIFWGIKRKEG